MKRDKRREVEIDRKDTEKETVALETAAGRYEGRQKDTNTTDSQLSQGKH